MAFGFGATFGSSTSDRLLLPSQTYDTLSTWSIWIYRNGPGGANFGTIWQDPGPRCILRNADAAGVMQVQIQFDSTTGVWTFPRPPLRTWAHILFTHDGTSLAAPACYLNGVAQTVTQTTAPAGTFVSTATALSVGNRASDSAVCWDGMLMRFGRWNRRLPAWEIAGLAAGDLPARHPTGLVTSYPFRADRLSHLAAAATSAGAPRRHLDPDTERVLGTRRVAFVPLVASTLVTAGRPPFRGAWRGMNRGIR